MGILEPFALLALPLLGVIVALYLLRFRRPTAPVASLRLWDIFTRDREANTLWQRLRVSVLLLLQIVALLALILALARPWVPSNQGAVRANVLLIDVSASMGAADADDAGRQTRLQAAQVKALQIVDDMPQQSTAMLIAVDIQASILVPLTDDKARLREAISSLSANASRTDLRDGLRMAQAAVAGSADGVIWVLSDGAFPPLPEGEATSAEFRFVPFGKERANQGITAMSLRDEDGELRLFVQVANSAATTITRRLDIAIDDAPWNARTLDIGPGGTQETIIPDIPIGARVIAATLAGHDSLSVDDAAWAVNRASVPANVLLVTSGSKFLETALALLPIVTLYKVTPDLYNPAAGVNGVPFDLTVFDSGVPTSTLATLPQSNILLVGPSGSNSLLTVGEVISNPVTLVTTFDTSPSGQDGSTGGRDPLLRFVDPTTFHVTRARQIDVPAWAHAVLGSDKGPLIIAGETEGRKVVALTFDLRDSDLPVQTAFPLLMRNLVTYLLPDPAAGLPSAVSPFTTVRVEEVSPVVDKILVEDPDGTEHTYPVTPEQPRVAFADTGQPGVYYVTQYSGDQVAAQEAFAVNLFSKDESATPPSAAVTLPESSAGGAENAPRAEVAREELWPLVALGGILLLLLEWVYAQRIAIRRALTEIRARRALRRAESERS